MKVMKTKIIFLLGLFTILLLIDQARAFEIFRPDEQGRILLESNRTTQELFLAASNTVNLRGTIDNDVVVAGMAVNLDNEINGNVFVAGQSVAITGKISGDLLVATNDFTFDKNASINGDLFLWLGNKSLIEGKIDGKVKIIGGKFVSINSSIGKDLELSTDRLQLLENASIGKDLIGTLTVPIAQSPLASIKGKNNLVITSPTVFHYSLDSVITKTYGLITFLALLLILQWTCPKIVNNIRQIAYSRPQFSLGLGLLLTLVFPSLFILLAVLIITLPLAFLELMLFGITGILGVLFSQLWLGDVIAAQRFSTIWSFVIGAVAALLISSIPFIGPFIRLAILLLGIGAVAQYFGQIFIKEVKA